MTKLKRRNGEQWQTIIAAQEKSGLDAKAYCRAQGIGLASFYAWRKRLTVGVAPARKKRGREFIELEQAQLEKPATDRPGFEAVLVFGEGISMTLRRG